VHTGRMRQAIALSSRALSRVPRAREPASNDAAPSLVRSGEVSVVNTTSKRLIKANHSKGWDAKPLAYVPQGRDRVAGLPGEHSTS
jgi:hypothetical protein